MASRLRLHLREFGFDVIDPPWVCGIVFWTERWKVDGI